MVLTGCGVLAVPDAARQAVEDWRIRSQEVDPCRVDAMEHCVGGSAAAWSCGSLCAIVLGRLLEIRQNDGNAMDLANNQLGAEECGLPILAGDPAPDGVGADAVSCCETLLNQPDGALVTDGPCN